MRLHLFVAVLISGLGYSQTILNSESLLNHSADKLTDPTQPLRRLGVWK